ncbi:MAG TPA: anti-sigma regulatory factor [Micromonosporaceae bacterium]|nr:anti-sigma regulatory factor [Micromonosporaceae bacterium]
MSGGRTPVAYRPGGDSETTGHDVVWIGVPADGSYLAVLRTATAGIAARLNFGLDEIEDLRIAVDEACGMLLGLAAPDSELSCRFDITADGLAVEVAVATVGTAVLPPAQSFAWQVLTALAADVSAGTVAGSAAIRLVSRGAEIRSATH